MLLHWWGKVSSAGWFQRFMDYGEEGRGARRSQHIGDRQGPTWKKR